MTPASSAITIASGTDSSSAKSTSTRVGPGAPREKCLRTLTRDQCGRADRMDPRLGDMVRTMLRALPLAGLAASLLTAAAARHPAVERIELEVAGLLPIG